MKKIFTVKELYRRCEETGDTEYQVLVFDPDSGNWEPLTGYTSNPIKKEIRLYSDKD